MSYQTGVATSQQDVVTQFVNFAVANGWTQNELNTVNRRAVISRGTVFMGFRWSAAASGGVIGLYQSTGYTGGNNVGAHPGDSGRGQVTTGAVTLERRLTSIGDGPYTALTLFSQSTDSPYIHAVLEYSPGLFRHFGCGTIEKIGTWTGGEYAVHTQWANGFGGAASNNLLWDSRSGQSSVAVGDEKSTMRVQGMPNQSGGMTWAVFSQSSSSLNPDAAGNTVINLRAGATGFDSPEMAFAFPRASPNAGYVPLFKIPIHWVDTTPTPNQAMLLGYAPDVRIMQMANFTPGQEFTVGSDTWKVFPMIRKQVGGSSDRSENAGIAYKKIT